MSLNENQTALKHKLTKCCELHHLTICQPGAGGRNPKFQTILHYSETSYVTFRKIYLARFIQRKFEKFCISDPLKRHRSAAGIFKKLKALDISFIIYQ